MRIFILFVFLGYAYGAPSRAEGVALCEVCHLLVGEVQDLVLQGQTQSVIGDYVSDICNRLPSTEKDVCNAFLSTNTEHLVDKLVSDLTPHQFCGQLPEVCPPQQAEQAEESVGGPLECELCKLAVLGIDKLIGQNRSSAAINATLEKFCDSLPEELGKLCKQIEPAILKGITQGFDPDTACKFAALCAAPRPGDITNLPCDLCNTVLDAIGVTDTESICAVQKTCILEAEKIRRELEKQDEVQDTLECQLCKFLVQAIDTLLGENRTAAEVNKTLTQFCNDLPGELKDSCISALPDILKAILGGIEPAKACDFVKICNDEGTIPVSNNYIPCDVCVSTMEALAGERGISICHQFEFVCGEEEAKPAFEQAPATPDEAPDCEICQFLVKSVVDLVGTERSMESVTNAVDTVCSNMPAVGRDLCGQFEDTLVEQIASGMVDPLEGCTLLAVCSGHERDISKAPVEHTKTNLKATPECELCQFIINVLDQFVTTNQSVQQINETLYNLCDKLPRDYQTICFRLVEQIDVVVASGIDPDKSCEAVKLCDDSAESLTANEGLCEICSLLVELLPEEQASKIKNNVCHKVCPNRVRRSIENEMAMMLPKFGSGGPAECELCHVAIRSIDELIAENKSVSEINKTVTEVCERLTGIQLQQQCMKVLPTLVKTLKTGLDPIKICKSLNMCTEENKRSKTKLLKKKIHKRSTAVGNLKDIKCDICKGIIQELDSVLEQNATIEKINETLYQTCDKLPGAIHDLCLQFAPQIISAIEQGVDPTDACSKIGVCTSLDDIKHIEQPVGDIKCDICELIINELDKLAGQNATDEKINATIYALCGELPGAAQIFCQNVAPTIVKAIKQGVDPQAACAALKLCSSVLHRYYFMESLLQKARSQQAIVQAKIKNLRAFQKPTVSFTKNVGDLKCNICELLVEELEKLIGANATDEKINATIYGLCNQLPGTAASFCQLIAPSMVKELEKGGDPQKTCSDVKLCSADIKPIEQPVGDIKCDICELIINELDKLAGQNATDEKINATIYALCGELPGAAQIFCQNVAPTIVKAIEQGLDPQAACAALKLCSTAIPKANSVRISNAVDVKCDICEFVINELDKVVADNGTDIKINATIFAACDKLDGTAAIFCKLIAPNVVKALEDGINTQVACKAVKLCPSSFRKPTVQLSSNVGDIKCDICELLVQELEKLIGANATDEKINATIYGLCDQLPGTAASFCQLIAPTIVKELEKGGDPQKTCSDVKLCSAAIPKANSVRISNAVDVKCDICEFVINELDKVLADNGTDIKINATIFAACDKLDGAAAIFCKLIAPNVVNAIEQGISTKEACKATKLCPSFSGPPPSNDLKCELCEMIVLKVDNFVGQNASDEKINQTVYKVCQDLSGTMQTFCLLVAPTVIKEIEMGAKPDQACAQLKLCGNHNDTRAIVQKPKMTKELHLSCADCARALEPVISDITNDYAKIQNVAQNICNNLPAIYRSQCMTLANDEHGYMWKPFLERYTPKMLCELAECTGNPPGNLS